MTYERYALYWAPAPGALADFGARWLGWDPETGTECGHPEIAGLPAPIAELTDTPRKYGLHGTLKPPFRLVDGACFSRLKQELVMLGENLAPVRMDRLALSRIGSFLALVPQGDISGLSALAARLVRDLDCFRAPLTREDLIRRQAHKLSGTHRELLDRWGYPYVMEEFRFHVTLTGKLTEDEARATHAALEPVLEPLLPAPFEIGEVCLFGEGSDGLFRNLHRQPLTGKA